jgi:hypothetical protein
MNKNQEPKLNQKIPEENSTKETSVTAQTVGYKAKAFEPRNLAFYFLLVFGLNAIIWVSVSIFGPKDLVRPKSEPAGIPATDKVVRDEQQAL